MPSMSLRIMGPPTPLGALRASAVHLSASEPSVRPRLPCRRGLLRARAAGRRRARGGGLAAAFAAFAAGGVVFGFAAAAAGFLAAVGFLVHGGPCAAFGFLLRRAAFLVAFLDVLGLAFLFAGVAGF